MASVNVVVTWRTTESCTATNYESGEISSACIRQREQLSVWLSMALWGHQGPRRNCCWSPERLREAADQTQEETWTCEWSSGVKKYRIVNYNPNKLEKRKQKQISTASAPGNSHMLRSLCKRLSKSLVFFEVCDIGFSSNFSPYTNICAWLVTYQADIWHLKSWDQLELKT